MRYRVESRFTEAVTKEIIRRGNGLRVQGSRDGADAVVEGMIRDFTFSGVLLDRNGRARVYEVTIVTAVTVRDLHDNKILYDNQNLTFRDSFEFSDDPRSFFNEEDPALRTSTFKMPPLGKLSLPECSRGCSRAKRRLTSTWHHTILAAAFVEPRPNTKCHCIHKQDTHLVSRFASPGVDADRGQQLCLARRSDKGPYLRPESFELLYFLCALRNEVIVQHFPEVSIPRSNLGGCTRFCRSPFGGTARKESLLLDEE